MHTPVRVLIPLVASASTATAQTADVEPQPAAPPEAVAADPAAEWDLKLAPLLWLPGLRGDIGLGGGETFDVQDLDLDEPRLTPGAQVTARFDRWTLFLSGFAFDADDEDTARDNIDTDGLTIPAGAEVEWDLSYASIKATLGRHVWTAPIESRGRVPRFPREVGPDETALHLDLYAGVRTFHIRTELDADGIGDASADADWAEPLIGARLIFDLPAGWSMQVATDAGGFALDDDSSLTWDIEFKLAYEVVQHLSAEVGFRHLSTNLENDDLDFDASLAGLYGAVVIWF